MSTLYLTQQDSVLRKEDERLKVTLKGETLLDLPILKVSQVVILGRVTITPHTVAALRHADRQEAENTGGRDPGRDPAHVGADPLIACRAGQAGGQARGLALPQEHPAAGVAQLGPPRRHLPYPGAPA